jgi:predicted hydrocarbon binding protein
MSDFDEIKENLALDDKGTLLLGDVPMILTPRWFFVGIMARLEKEVGLDCASSVLYGAAWDGAYRWAEAQVSSGLEGRAVMDQYLGSMTLRGWGRFTIEAFDDAAGTGRFLLYNSAVARERGETGAEVCSWIPGAMAGCMQAIIDRAGRYGIKVTGSEVSCASQGKTICEFAVGPAQV